MGKISGFRCQVSGPRFRVSGFRFEMPRFQVSGFRRKIMDKLIENSLHALLAREGLQSKARELGGSAIISELCRGNLECLHSVAIGGEEGAGVFRPEWTGK